MQHRNCNFIGNRSRNHLVLFALFKVIIFGRKIENGKWKIKKKASESVAVFLFNFHLMNNHFRPINMNSWIEKCNLEHAFTANFHHIHYNRS